MDDVNGHTVPCQIILKMTGDLKGEFGDLKGEFELITTELWE